MKMLGSCGDQIMLCACSVTGMCSGKVDQGTEACVARPNKECTEVVSTSHSLGVVPSSYRHCMDQGSVKEDEETV